MVTIPGAGVTARNQTIDALEVQLPIQIEIFLQIFVYSIVNLFNQPFGALNRQSQAMSDVNDRRASGLSFLSFLPRLSP